MKEFKGKWNINNSEQVGTCCIDDDNHITLTIHKSDLESGKERIIGQTDYGEVVLYDTFLIDNGYGFYKYRACYATHSTINLNQYDKVNNIIHIKFLLPGLGKWINKEKFNIKEDDKIIINKIKDITLLNEDNIKIQIKYEVTGKEYIDKNCDLSMIKNIPYIHVYFTSPKDHWFVYKTVKMINRFFGLMMGYCENIKFIICNWNSEEYGDMYKFDLYLDYPFNYNMNIKETYLESFRINFNMIEENIEEIFSNWYLLYNNKQYDMPLNLYFLPNNNTIIEERFLQLCKISEYLFSIDNIQETEKIKGLAETLSVFFSKHNDELKQSLNSCGIKSKYVKKLKKITNDIIESTVSGYKNRISLDEKIKLLDKESLISSKFCENEVINRTTNLTDGYNAIRKTRNYYTHLDEAEDILDVKYIQKYSLIIELLIIRWILEKIKLDNKLIDEITREEPYISINI